MDTLLELLKMVGALAVAGLALAWIGSGAKRRIGRNGEHEGEDDPNGPIVDDMHEIGTLGGLGGGELEDLVVGRFALRRTKMGERDRGRR